MFPWPGSPRDRKCPPPPPVYYVPAPPPPPPVVYAAPPPPVVYEVPVPPVVYEVPAPPPVVYEVPAPVIYKAPPRDDYYEYSPRHHHHHHRGCVDEFRDVSWAVMETAAERGYLDILSFAADTADSGPEGDLCVQRSVSWRAKQSHSSDLGHSLVTPFRSKVRLASLRLVAKGVL
ncbi:hypothetical protein PC120_g10349 [Phytophthora cactorum]|nr:hypothetical protein PC120_g10349 [Phytophthora cactorum]